MGQINHTIYPKLWMLYWGSLDKGHHFYGTFKTYYAASEWARLHLHVGTISRIIEMSDVRKEI